MKTQRIIKYQNINELNQIVKIFVGTRYFIRGLDAEGNAANYVETEQIAQFESGACSFVQVCKVRSYKGHIKII